MSFSTSCAYGGSSFISVCGKNRGGYKKKNRDAGLPGFCLCLLSENYIVMCLGCIPTVYGDFSVDGIRGKGGDGQSTSSTIFSGGLSSASGWRYNSRIYLSALAK